MHFSHSKHWACVKGTLSSQLFIVYCLVHSWISTVSLRDSSDTRSFTSDIRTRLARLINISKISERLSDNKERGGECVWFAFTRFWNWDIVSVLITPWGWARICFVNCPRGWDRSFGLNVCRG